MCIRDRGGTDPGSGASPADPFPGTIGSTPTNGWGSAGGDSGGGYQGGGGGGADTVGRPGGGGSPGAGTGPTVYAAGGMGIQLPATFRDPKGSVGGAGPTSPTITGADTSGKYWVCGGGGGGGSNSNSEPHSGMGGGSPTYGSPWSGGGQGAWDNHSATTPTGIVVGNNGESGASGTGGGGGGAAGEPGIQGEALAAGSGGSGLVLIAYPA